MRLGYRRAAANRLWLLYLLPLTLFTSIAAAQDTAWAPRAAQRVTPWFDAVRTELESAEVVVHAAEGADGCASTGASLEVAQRLGVARALCLDVASAHDAVVINARLARSGTQVGEGSARVEHGDYAKAAREAYRLAEVALDLGDAGLLRVQTSPQGAMVALDGEPIGHAPLERKLPPGSHEVSVTLEGFSGEHRRVEVVRGGVSEVQAKLARGVLDADGDVGAPRVQRASAINWWLGGALVLGSAPLLVLSLSTLARDGSCAMEHTSDANCTERVQFGTRSALLLGMGLGALIAGGAVLVVQPFTVDVAVSPEHALLQLRAPL